MAGSVPNTAQAVREALPPPEATDSPDLANKRAGWRKFPMVMRHPAFQPAIVSNDRTVDAEGREKWVNAPPGKPIMWPPVTVLNEAQEELHRSRGYVGSGDPVALNHAEVAPEPPGYVYQEYPRLLDDGTLDLGPDAPKPPDNFYPYWVRMPGWPDELVEDQEAHAALLAKRGIEGPPRPPDPVDARDVEIASLKAQLEEVKALILAQARGQLGGAPTPAADATEPAPPIETPAEPAYDPENHPGEAAEVERELEAEQPPTETAEEPAAPKKGKPR